MPLELQLMRPKQKPRLLQEPPKQKPMRLKPKELPPLCRKTFKQQLMISKLNKERRRLVKPQSKRQKGNRKKEKDLPRLLNSMKNNKDKNESLMRK